MPTVNPVFRAIAASTKSVNALAVAATAPVTSLVVGDLNILWICVVPSAASTDPGIPTVNGVAIAAAGATNSAGWKTLGTSYDTGSPGTRITAIYRVCKANDPDHVDWAWVSAGNFITGGEAWQTGTFDPADPIPSASAAFQAQAASSATFPTPSVSTVDMGVICSIFSNRTGGTWNTLPDTTRSADYVTSSINYGVTDTNAVQVPGTYTRSAIFSGATSVGNTGIWLVKSNPGTATNASPTANAGVDQGPVEAGSLVTLDGLDADSDGVIASRTWSQVGGQTVTLTNVSATSRTFSAPITLSGASLIFQYAVTDNNGATGTDTITVTVLPAARRVKINDVILPSIQRVNLP